MSGQQGHRGERGRPGKRGHRGQRGQVTVVFAVLATSMVMLGGLAYDGARILNARQQAVSLASEAARAGAQAISPDSVYGESPSVTVDLEQARIAAARYLADAHGGWGEHAEWSLSVSGDTVSATVWRHQPLQFLSMLGMDSRRVTGTATARAVIGTSTGGGL